MNEDIKKNKIDRFLKDEGMSNAVYEVLLNCFLKESGVSDVQTLAAEKIAILLLQSAWKQLSKYQTTENSSSPPLRQVGL
jgi:hypothetical protein